jgi:hypothetical protein
MCLGQPETTWMKARRRGRRVDYALRRIIEKMRMMARTKTTVPSPMYMVAPVV